MCICLMACATTQPLVSNAPGCESSVRVLTFDEACEDEGSLLAVCGPEWCAVYRCQEVAGELLAGKVLPTRGVATPRPPSSARRYRGSAQGLPKNSQPVFIIPWGPKPKQELLPSQNQMLEELKAQRTRIYEMHHIFPREFKEWFKEKGIDIDLYTLPLAVEEHQRIHRGDRGGPWNAAWRAWIKKHAGASQAEIHQFAGQLIYEFEPFGPIVPFRPRVLQPPPIGGY